jgi:two-component system, chemotaxis family, protein-glutamate methylesterase/glutaminase
MGGENKARKTIRVLVADDSAFMRTAVTRMLESDPQLKVVAEARDGRDALTKIADFDPDVVTLDIEMPILDGLSVLRALMETNPKPVIMLSSLTQDGAESTLTALELGAFDCLAKARSFATLDILQIKNELIAKVKAAADSNPIRTRVALTRKRAPAMRAVRHHSGDTAMLPPIVAIGASTGGPRVLQEILPRLPADLPAGILIVQHMPKGFTGPFAKRLNDISEIEVCEAVEGQLVKRGCALLAPATWHMTLFQRTANQFAVHLSKTPSDTAHIPCVDVMMLSVADVCGSNATGVILTGMGNDGAAGMKAIAEEGGHTLGQDEATCAVYGMPRACAEMGILNRVVPLEAIADEIIHSVCVAREATRPAG